MTDTAFDDTSTDKSKDMDDFNGDCRSYIDINGQQPWEGCLSARKVTMSQQDITRHNQNLLHTLSKGDLVEFPRGTYSHWGIYVGDENIIHLVTEEQNSSHGFMGFGSNKTKGCVRKDYFFGIAGRMKAMKNNYLDHILRAFTPDVIVERAKSKIGRTDYDLFNNNCEHFAVWCRYGKTISQQAIKAAKSVDTEDTVETVTVVGVIAGVAAVAAGIGLTLLKLL